MPVGYIEVYERYEFLFVIKKLKNKEHASMRIFAAKVFFLFTLILMVPSLHAITEEQLQNSVKESDAWLSIVDKGDYGRSWEDGSLKLRLTMPKNEWIKYLQGVRQTAGPVQTRTLADVRIAKNPAGLSKGDYSVVVYNTTFPKGPAKELLTLALGPDGNWRVMTYFIEQK
jgi:hypothetical protein